MPFTTAPAWQMLVDAAGARFRGALSALDGAANVVVTRRDVADAAAAAAIDTWTALESLGRLAFVVLYPVVVFVLGWARALLCRLYDRWIVQGGIKQAALAVYRFHADRTRDELLVEASLFAVAAAVFALRRYLSRTKLVLRAQIWTRKKRRIIQQRYRVFVNRLAKISRVFAYLFATVVMYIAMAVAARLLLPKLVRWLACETVLPAALSQMYPFVATAMCLAFTEGEGDSQPQPPPTSPPPRRRRGRGSRDGADGRRVNSSNNSNNGEQVEDGGGGGESSSEKLRYWLDYWMVYSAYQWLRAVALSFAGAQSATAAAWWKPAWLTRLCLEAELAWFVWLLVVPYLSSITAGATTDDEQDDEDEDDDNLLLLSKTPLYHIARAVGGAAQFIQNHVAAVCSEAAWQYFLNVVSPFLALATTLRMLSPAARDRIVHVLSELRTVVLPAALSLVPGIASRVAIPYARTVLSLAKSNAATETAKDSRQRKRQRRANGNAGGGGGDASLLRISCQYWILQFLTTSLLKQTSLIWWLSWLPLGNLVIFAVWWQLSFPMAIELIYGLVVEELERSVVYIFYHVDQQMSSGATAADANDGEEADAVANGEKNVQTPRLVAAAGWFFSKLPSAHDLQERPAAARPSPRRPRRESSHGQRGERATRDEANADDGEEEDAVVEDQEEEVEDPAESDDESFNPGSDMEGDDDSRPRRKQHANASSSVSSSAGRGRRAAAEAPPARRATRRTTRNASPLY